MTCVDFAQKHGLMSHGDADKVKKLAEIKTGPGGCTSQKECEAFCNDSANVEACVKFGEEHNLISKDEADQGRKVAQALHSGTVLPGGCKNKSECQAYCSDPTHSQECLDFAEKAGFMTLLTP